MAREIAERAMPYSAACGSPVWRWTRVTSRRSVKTRSCFGVGTGLPVPLGTAPLMKLRLAPGEPRVGQLFDRIAEMCR
jgi:hypothetical protein